MGSGACVGGPCLAHSDKGVVRARPPWGGRARGSQRSGRFRPTEGRASRCREGRTVRARGGAGWGAAEPPAEAGPLLAAQGLRAHNPLSADGNRRPCPQPRQDTLPPQSPICPMGGRVPLAASFSLPICLVGRVLPTVSPAVRKGLRALVSIVLKSGVVTATLCPSRRLRMRLPPCPGRVAALLPGRGPERCHSFPLAFPVLRERGGGVGN